MVHTIFTKKQPESVHVHFSSYKSASGSLLLPHTLLPALYIETLTLIDIGTNVGHRDAMEISDRYPAITRSELKL